MKFVTTLYFVLSACSVSIAQYNEANLKLEERSKVSPGGFKNLVLYPVKANGSFLAEHKTVGNYLTLKEGLDSKKIKITDHGTVNDLYVENVSSDTIMILSGEVVQGGKQDRMIAQDLILRPHSGQMNVPVYCVEHGRWTAKENGNAFRGYYTISSNEVRKAGTVGKNQQEVWDNVAKTTTVNKAESGTGALTALKESGEFNDKLREYTQFFGHRFTDEKDVIGVIAVSGNGILGCDMFATHELFVKTYPNLLNSYSAEAITSGGQPTVSYDEVNQYLKKIIDNESEQEEEVKKKGTMLKDGKRKIHISTF